MTERLQETIDQFQMVDAEFRLQMLLEYAENLPPLPEELHEARDKGFGRVKECQSPVYLWVNVADETVKIHADVPKESPTVRGFVALLVKSLNGASPEEVADVPLDLLRQLGIASMIGMTRSRGLSAVLRRVKNEVSNSSSAVATDS